MSTSPSNHDDHCKAASMGFADFWPQIQAACEITSLHSYVVSRGFIDNVNGSRTLFVGIDVSGWFYRASAWGSSTSCTRSAEIANLFNRAVRLLKLPITPIFVFDGKDRPSRKRNLTIDTENEHWLALYMCQMLDAFGFAWWNAPGEAEAELVWMASVGIIDSVMTDDSDVFAFGTVHVIRFSPGNKDDNEVEVYKPEAVRLFGLTQEDVIFMALLAGGDYSDGIPGCGIKIALDLAKTGLGQALLASVREKDEAELGNFLPAWRTQVVSELAQNISGHLSKYFCDVAAAVPSEFPDVGIVKKYISPVISGNVNEVRAVVNTARVLNIGALATFVGTHLSWGRTPRLLQRFSAEVFPGLVASELLHHACLLDRHVIKHPFTIPIITAVVSKRFIMTDTGCDYEARVQMNIPRRLVKTLCDIGGRAVGPAQSLSVHFGNLPCAMVQHVLPYAADYNHLECHCKQVESSRPYQGEHYVASPATAKTSKAAIMSRPPSFPVPPLPPSTTCQFLTPSTPATFQPAVTLHRTPEHEAEAVSGSIEPVSIIDLTGDGLSENIVPGTRAMGPDILLQPRDKSFRVITHITNSGKEVLELESDSDGGGAD